MKMCRGVEEKLYLFSISALGEDGGDLHTGYFTLWKQ
jgi:hypothetical protein